MQPPSVRITSRYSAGVSSPAFGVGVVERSRLLLLLLAVEVNSESDWRLHNRTIGKRLTCRRLHPEIPYLIIQTKDYEAAKSS